MYIYNRFLDYLTALFNLQRIYVHVCVCVCVCVCVSFNDILKCVIIIK